MLTGCCCVLVLALIAAVSGVDKYRIVGSEVRFKPYDTAELLNPSSIIWKHSNAGKVAKVLTWDSEDNISPVRNPNFINRVDFNNITGELTIKDLRQEHTGLYTIEINNKVTANEFKLTVMDGVPKPELKTEATNNNPDVVYLVCEYVEKINWKCTNKETSVGSSLNKDRKGESYTFEKTGNPDTCCTCTLTNTVSSKTSDPVCEKDLFHENGYVEAVVGAVIGIIFIALIPIIFLALYLGNKKCHDQVYSEYKDTPCVGGILGHLESCRKKGPQQDEEKRNGNEEAHQLKASQNDLSAEDKQEN